MRTGGRGLCGASGGGVGDADRGGKKRGGVRVKCLARDGGGRAAWFFVGADRANLTCVGRARVKFQRRELKSTRPEEQQATAFMKSGAD